MSIPSRSTRAALLCGSLLALAALPAQALVSLNDGKDKFFVSASATMTHDTNFYANKYGYAETYLSTTVTGEYSRRAGEIGVDASAGVKMTSHDEFPGENYQNPFFKASFTKSGGRTTGALLLNASRESDNDSAATTRVTYWTYGSELSLKYPVIERYSITGGLGYSVIDYVDDRVLFDLDTFFARADLNYALDSQHDLIFGYRYRDDMSAGAADFNDHDLYVGIRGKILPKMTGLVRMGYQFRNQQGATRHHYSGLSALASTTWIPTKKTSVTTQVLKDFHTTSTDVASDVLTGSIQASRVLNAEWSAGAGATAGHTRFLGALTSRKDDFVSLNAYVSWSANEHLRVSFSYTYFKNNSTLSYADYTRDLFGLSVSSRW